MRYLIVVLCSVVLLTGCAEKNRFKKSFQELVKTSDGLFRGASFGDTFEQVLNQEQPMQPDFQDSTMIRYKLHYTDSEHYEINYMFTEHYLSSIMIDCYMGQVNDGEKMTELFQAHFDKLYGPGQQEQGIWAWRGKKNEGIEVMDESELYGYGKLKVWFYTDPHVKTSTPQPAM